MNKHRFDADVLAVKFSIGTILLIHTGCDVGVLRFFWGKTSDLEALNWRVCDIFVYRVIPIVIDRLFQGIVKFIRKYLLLAKG